MKPPGISGTRELGMPWLRWFPGTRRWWKHSTRLDPVFFMLGSWKNDKTWRFIQRKHISQKSTRWFSKKGWPQHHPVCSCFIGKLMVQSPVFGNLPLRRAHDVHPQKHGDSGRFVQMVWRVFHWHALTHFCYFAVSSSI
jgi:hypothetical protein